MDRSEQISDFNASVPARLPAGSELRLANPGFDWSAGVLARPGLAGVLARTSPRDERAQRIQPALCILASVLLFLLALASCTVGPKYKRPSAPVPQVYKEPPPASQAANSQWKTATPSDGELRGNWWEIFGDPQLNVLESQVVVSNQNVKQAEAQFRQARALVALNRANAYPITSTSPSATFSHTPGTLGSRGFGGGRFDQYILPFTATWEPDLWGRVRLAVENAAANAQSFAADLENMRLSMQAELAADYFSLAGTDMQEKLLTDTITAYQRALDLTVARFNSGVASRADVAQAQTQLESTRAQLTDVQVTRAQLEHAIAVLTGQPPATFSLAPLQIRNLPPPIPAGAPSQLLERRPDIAAAERLVAAANANIGLAQVAYYPLVTLSAEAGLQSSSLANWFTWPARFWSYGPSASQTLFDFGRRRAATEQARAIYDTTVAGYRQTVLAAFQDVEDNLAALRLLEQEAAEQAAAVKAAQESVTLELGLYKAGTVSYLNVITTQTIALTNERTAVSILQRRLVSAVQLIRALGGGWNAATLPTPADLKSSTTANPANVALPPPKH